MASGALTVLPLAVVERFSDIEHETSVKWVIKELIENAIDAQATSVTIEVENSGYSYIKVVDNGAGIPLKYTHRVAKYHSTSKIRDLTDLSHISTLGYHGTSLAHISCIADLSVTSRARDTTHGFTATYSFNLLTKSAQVACPEGTTVEVSNLLYNYPDLRYAKIDHNVCIQKLIHMVSKYAISNPQISFRVVTGTESVFLTEEADLPEYVMTHILGDVPMAKIESTHDDISIQGHIIMTGGNTPLHGIFLNGRLAKCPKLKAEIVKKWSEKHPDESFSFIIHIRSSDTHQLRTENCITPAVANAVVQVVNSEIEKDNFTTLGSFEGRRTKKRPPIQNGPFLPVVVPIQTVPMMFPMMLPVPSLPSAQLPQEPVPTSERRKKKR